MNPNTIPIIWVGFIGAVPLLLFDIWRRPSLRDVAATTTRHDSYGWASAESGSCHGWVRHDGMNEQKFGGK